MKLRNKLRQNVIEPWQKRPAIEFKFNTARQLPINNAETTKDQPLFNESHFKVKEDHKVTVKIKNNPNLSIKILESPTQVDENALEKVNSIDVKVKSEATTNYRASLSISSGIYLIILQINKHTLNKLKM